MSTNASSALCIVFNTGGDARASRAAIRRRSLRRAPTATVSSSLPQSVFPAGAASRFFFPPSATLATERAIISPQYTLSAKGTGTVAFAMAACHPGTLSQSAKTRVHEVGITTIREPKNVMTNSSG